MRRSVVQLGPAEKRERRAAEAVLAKACRSNARQPARLGTTFVACSPAGEGRGTQRPRCGRSGGSATCAICRREAQLVALTAIAPKLAAVSPQSYLVTVVPGSWRRPIDQLGAWSVRKAKAQVYRALEGLGGRAVAIGALDVSLEVSLDGGAFWVPHAHLIVAGASAKRIRSAFAELALNDVARAPLHVEPIRDMNGALAYALKPPGLRRVAYRTDIGVRHRRVPLRAQERRLLDEALSTKGQLDLVLTLRIGFPTWARVQIGRKRSARSAR